MTDSSKEPDQQRPLTHMEEWHCDLLLPNDVMTFTLAEIDCPECLKRLASIKERRAQR
jgi:hypothetical protein